MFLLILPNFVFIEQDIYALSIISFIFKTKHEKSNPLRIEKINKLLAVLLILTMISIRSIGATPTCDAHFTHT